MKHASRAASLLAAALAGCGADLSLPEGARIECDEQRPCPAPLVCAVRVARCVPAQGGDRETPSVVSGSVRIEPDPAALGALVEVSFLVSEPLATAPRLTLDTADATPLAVVEADGPAYRYGYRPSGGEPAGPVNVLATLVDRSGNLAADLTLGSVTFDFGAPRVLRVVAPDGTRIREGATARIELTVSEPLAAPPTVTLSGRDEPLAPDPGVEPPVYQVVHEVTPADGEGPKDVVVLATDLAGNTGRHEVEALLWFDLTPPGIDGEVVLSNRVARPGTVVGVALSASEPLGADPVVALEREAGDARLPMTLEEAAGSSYVFTHEVAPGQDGRYRVVIDLVDRSGLRSRVSPEQGFVLDTTPPVIADGRLTTVPVVSGLYGEPVLAVGTVHTLRASFTLREDRGLLPDSPLVFLDTNAGPLPFEQVERVRQPDPGVEACTFELSLDADTRSQVEGVLGWPVRVVAEDEAGNRTVEAELAGEPVRVDVSPPEAECLQNRLVAKPADRLRVDAHFSEPVRPGSVGPVCWEEGDGQERPCGPDELEGEAAEPRGTPPHFAWGYTVPADGLASWRFSLQAQDLVGNAGAGGLVCDVTVPIDRESIGVRDGSVTVTTGEGAQRRATGGFARNGARVEVRFTAGEPPAPGSLHVRLGGIELDVAAREEQEDGSVDLVFEHVVEGVEPEDLEGDDPPNPAEPEGSVPVSLEMADAAGNVTVESLGSVVRDYRGPRLVGQPYFERADGYERARLGEDGYVVRTGDTVEVSFALGEPVAAGVPDAVVITVAGVRVATLQPEEQEQTHFTASLTNAAGAWPEGDADVHVLALDRAGNLGDRRLGRIRSDYGRPAPLDGLRQPRVRLYRAPVGSQETGGTPLIELRGCPPPPGAEDEESWAWCPRDEDGGPSPDAAFEPAAQVDVWEVTHEGGLACDDRLVRTGTADPDTGTLRLPLPGDRAAVCVTQTDVSGQTSLRAVVRHGQWLATLGGKVPGSTAENPHRLLHVTRFDEAMLRQPGRESEPADVGRVALPAEEDEAERVLTVAGDREWRYLETYAAAPEPLAGQTIAWDPIHGRTVYLAGGRPWFWLGDAWREAPVDATPGFVYEPVFAFDAARGRLVLFGGASFDEGRPLRDETWESDGTGWVLVNRDGDRPLHRYGHAGAYDPRRARLVVHGGYGFGRGVEPGILSDLWEWDGEAWEPREPEGDAPPALFGHSMVWSASRRAVLLYGGCRQAQPQVAGHEPLCTAYSRQLWEWDGESWSPAPDPGDPPPPRQYAGMAYDSGRDRVVLFGGLYVDLLGGEATFRDDLWEWDGERWEERHPPGGRPRGRVNHALG